MTFKLPENVYQTSNGGGVGALNLVAPPAGRASFADWLANGDTTIATIKDLNGRPRMGDAVVALLSKRDRPPQRAPGRARLG